MIPCDYLNMASILYNIPLSIDIENKFEQIVKQSTIPNILRPEEYYSICLAEVIFESEVAWRVEWILEGEQVLAGNLEFISVVHRFIEGLHQIFTEENEELFKMKFNRQIAKLKHAFVNILIKVSGVSKKEIEMDNSIHKVNFYILGKHFNLICVLLDDARQINIEINGEKRWIQ